MRRFLIIWMSVLPQFLTAANTLTLSTVSGHPGETLTVSASLANTDAVVAVQADIPLGANLRFVANSAELSSARSNGHSIMAAAANDTLHITIFSLAGNALIGQNGELFSFQITLGLEPATYLLTPEVTMVDANSQALVANAISGEVTLLSPKIEVSTKTIDYGHIPIRSTYARALQVRNIGNEPLVISDVLFSAAEFSVATDEYTIPAGQTQSITISFAPVLHGAISESVRLRSNAINDPDVYGANTAMLVADPYSVNELRVQPASGISDSIVAVTLRMNNMETDLVGVQVSFKMPAALVYIENSVAPLARAAGLSATSTMSNDTLTLMLYSLGNTPIADEDGDLMTFSVRLNGSSGSYALRPINTMLINSAQQNMVSAVYNANVTIQSPRISSNASLSFGHIPVTKKDTADYTVANTGQAPLMIEGAAFLQAGLRVITPLPVSVARNTSSTLQIEFTPSAEGNISTTMQLYSNDPTTRMKSVAVSASVFEPNTMTLTGAMVGDNYVLEVGMENYSELTGVQFDLSGLTDFHSCEKTSRVSSHMLSWSKLDDESYRFILFAMDNTPIGHGGTLLTLVFNAEQARLLDGHELTMDNIVVVHTSNGAKEITAPLPWLVSTTDTPSGIESIVSFVNSAKILRDGQIYILRGEKEYTLQGQEAK